MAMGMAMGMAMVVGAKPHLGERCDEVCSLHGLLDAWDPAERIGENPQIRSRSEKHKGAPQSLESFRHRGDHLPVEGKVQHGSIYSRIVRGQKLQGLGYRPGGAHNGAPLLFKNGLAHLGHEEKVLNNEDPGVRLGARERYSGTVIVHWIPVSKYSTWAAPPVW